MDPDGLRLGAPSQGTAELPAPGAPRSTAPPEQAPPPPSGDSVGEAPSDSSGHEAPPTIDETVATETVATENLERARRLGLAVIRQHTRASALQMAVIVALGLPLLWVRSPAPVDWMVLGIVTVTALWHLVNSRRHIRRYCEAGGQVDTRAGLRHGLARVWARLGGAR